MFLSLPLISAALLARLVFPRGGGADASGAGEAAASQGRAAAGGAGDAARRAALGLGRAASDPAAATCPAPGRRGTYSPVADAAGRGARDARDPGAGTALVLEPVRGSVFGWVPSVAYIHDGVDAWDLARAIASAIQRNPQLVVTYRCSADVRADVSSKVSRVITSASGGALGGAARVPSPRRPGSAEAVLESPFAQEAGRLHEVAA